MTRRFEEQIIEILLALILMVIGVVQLFFANQLRDRLLLVRQYLQGLYERHPLLMKMFGPPLRMTVLRGYTVRRRRGLRLLHMVWAFVHRDSVHIHCLLIILSLEVRRSGYGSKDGCVNMGHAYIKTCFLTLNRFYLGLLMDMLYVTIQFAGDIKRIMCERKCLQ